MLLWFAFALLTAAVLAWLLAPLARPAPAAETAAAADAGTRAVYRDQLAEVEAERAAGLIGPAEAEAAKAEIARRLLASAAPAEPAVAAAPRTGLVNHAHTALATAIAVPLLTLALYLAHGSPGMPSGSLSTLSEAQRQEMRVARLVAEVEARLRENPDDGKGWEVLAPVYLRLGRYADAANAYANAVRLQGESAKLLAGLAESSIFARDGIVTDEARNAYQKLLKLEPGLIEPRFWLAMGKEQDGRLADALADYTAMLKEAPPDAPYRGALDERIKDVSARMAGGPANDAAKEAAKTAEAGKPAPGPDAAALKAAARLSPEQRRQMIAGMVEGLAQRLKRDGKDLPGWLRLVNAYAVLGRHDDARAALADARRNFAGDANALSELSRLSTTLGLGS
jgi:cytochrome c-type biogenesis protein CcmH